MILKRGVSGFGDQGSELIRVDEQARIEYFKKCCYANVLQLGGVVLEWHEPKDSITYAHALVKIDGELIYVLHHDVYDYIAFTKNREWTNLDFVNHKELAILFNEQFQVLSQEQLEEKLIKGKTNKKGGLLLNEHDLAVVELGQIHYFSSETVGQIVFNYWD